MTARYQLAGAALSFALLSYCPAALTQTMYKCVDQEGNSSYGSSPCQPGATEEWAREMSPQRRSSPAPRAQRPARPAMPAPSAEEVKSGFRVVSISARATEKNSVWWRYAWRLTISNFSSSTSTFRATVKFLDRDGFVIEEDTARDIVIGPGQTATHTDFELVRLPGATRVDSTSVRVHKTR